MLYFAKTPGWLQKLYRECIWRLPAKENTIYLTFDDGPHPVATPFVLDTLKAHGASATFFCIGKNVVANPDLYKRIIAEGHSAGNHSFNHLNGWKTTSAIYLRDIQHAGEHIASRLFRPPYGRIKKNQLSQLLNRADAYQVIMWTVLSGDFDTGITGEQCLQNVVKNVAAGSIIVFHDSEKAYPRLAYTLPKLLTYLKEKGYRFEKITMA